MPKITSLIYVFSFNKSKEMTKIQKYHSLHHFEISRFFTQRHSPRQAGKSLKMSKKQKFDCEGPEGLWPPYLMIENH